ncbi:hypothetical protein [Pseudomonas phage vB_PaeM_PAO1_Ab17]|uniref:Uncharacterized protein n=2 Tax=Nankokuvirus Ab03 TaxID=1925780 RepID=A0A0A1IWW4_9CAUD|nr:hypothetical protein VC54_gp100 [Pseudomonas phage vB_PaeM_PAO1_Ab03]CEF89216.1 hypothetical protein [Pseudomonas phage vB_PaeM_PAO1_Ab03]CEF89592.1 hypothetical protein [Pseudomonas phage vB_PaeM_PAO1_Ab17]
MAQNNTIIVNDQHNVYVLRLPNAYFGKDIPVELKEDFQYWKEQLHAVAQGYKNTLMLPSVTDYESRQPLYDFQILPRKTEQVSPSTITIQN